MYHLISSQQSFQGGRYRYPPHFVDQETEVSGMEQLAGTHTNRKRHIQDLGLGGEVAESMLLSLGNSIDTNMNVTQTQTLATMY